ncbi:MAG: cation transporter [Lachnospiraceae bacterium]|nr:cation transporter [Lachnospiraceae bacterium]
MEERSKDFNKTDEKQEAMYVSRVSIAVNMLLSVFKLVAGIIGHSGAMISDAVHSASDVFSTVVVMIGVSAANKKADKDHPYGHERMECVAAIVLAVVLLGTGIMIGADGIGKIMDGKYESLKVPGILALAAALISIAVKEWMYWFTIRTAKRIQSDALRADAWHHRSDALSSVGALVGIGGARLGFPIMDSVACLVICVFIVKAAVDIFMDAVNKMVDKACDDQTMEEMRRLISRQEGVLGVNALQTRMFGSKIYVDAEIEADGELPLTQAHQIAELVHDVIEAHFPRVKHCMVHVNPEGEGH